jgi:hypothetical protein
VKKKVVIEDLRKYGVRAKYDDVPDTTTPRHNSTNPEAEICCANLGTETET